MPPDEFWNDKPDLFYSYVEATARKWKREEAYRSQSMDYQSWLTGLYCYEAFGVVLANVLKKGSKAKYSKEPMSIKQYRQEKASKTEERVKKLEAEYLGFKALADAINRRR